MRPSKYQNNNTESLMGGPDFVYASGLDHSFFLIFRKTGRHLFLQCFKFGKAMYIICSKIRVGIEGGGPFSIGGSIFHRGIWTLLNMDPGSIFRGVHIQYDTGRPIDMFTPISHNVNINTYMLREAWFICQRA